MLKLSHWSHSSTTKQHVACQFYNPLTWTLFINLLNLYAHLTDKITLGGLQMKHRISATVCRVLHTAESNSTAKAEIAGHLFLPIKD